MKGTLPMLAARTNNIRAAPTTTVAELQDTLADRARGYHEATIREHGTYSRGIPACSPAHGLGRRGRAPFGQ